MFANQQNNIKVCAKTVNYYYNNYIILWLIEICIFAPSVYLIFYFSTENQIKDNPEKAPLSDRLSKKPQSYDTSDYADSSLTEEIHNVQEDRARSFLQDFIQGRNSQESQNQHVKQQHATIQEVNNNTDNLGKLNPTLQINSHFKELKTRQKEEQQMFHQKLMQELTTSASRTRTSPSLVNTGKSFCNFS